VRFSVFDFIVCRLSHLLRRRQSGFEDVSDLDGAIARHS
jgi:hypothetical protein